MIGVFLVPTDGFGYGPGEGTQYESDMGANEENTMGRNKGRGGGPKRGFGLYVDRDFLEEAVLLFWGDGLEDHENNNGYGVNDTDRYSITYRGRRRHSYCRIRGRGALLEAAGHNDGCVWRCGG